MALAISPLMLALVVIIGVELIVVILSICYLLWRGRAGKYIYLNASNILLSVSSGIFFHYLFFIKVTGQQFEINPPRFLILHHFLDFAWVKYKANFNPDLQCKWIILKTSFFLTEQTYIQNTRQFLKQAFTHTCGICNDRESNPYPCEFESDSLPLRLLKTPVWWFFILCCTKALSRGWVYFSCLKGSS